MTEGTGKSHSVGGRRVELLPRGASKHVLTPPKPPPTHTHTHTLATVARGPWLGARLLSEDVHPQGFWKIGSSSIWGRRVGVGGGGGWPEQECKQRLHKS